MDIPGQTIIATDGDYTVEVAHCKVVKNKRPHYYIGRPSPLGNPFTVKEHGHNEAISMFKQWLNIQWRTNNPRVMDELKRLAKDLKSSKHIILACWCAPKPCHGEVIADALFALIKKDLI